VKIGAGDWEFDADTDAVAAFTSEPGTLCIGEGGATRALTDSKIDDVKIWTSYDQN
jgi:hypothetical protein